MSRGLGDVYKRQIIYHRVKHKKSVFMRVCRLLHFPTGENGHLPTGENEEKASFAYGGK